MEIVKMEAVVLSTMGTGVEEVVAAANQVESVWAVAVEMSQPTG